MTKGFSIVVAMDENRGIGKDGKLPWKLSGDMKFFKELTTCPDREAVEKRWGLKPGESSEVLKWEDVSANLKFAHKLPEPSEEKRNAVIMGRKTWQSIPKAYRPLLNRGNVVLSRAGYTEPGILNTFPMLSMVMEHVIPEPYLSEAFVIGGGQIFSDALKWNLCAHLYITEIDAMFDCDTFFPEIPAAFTPTVSSPWIKENGIRYRFRRYDRT